MGDRDTPNPDGTWPLAVIDGRAVSECIGCGFCCSAAPCALAYSVLKLETNVPPDHHASPGSVRCPALRQEGDRYRCGLILDADGEERKKLLTALYVGAGCCSALNTRRRQRYLAKRAAGERP